MTKTRVIVLIALAVAALIYVYAVGLKDFKDKALTSADNIAFGFRQAKKSLFGFDPEEASFYFKNVGEEIATLKKQLPIFSNFIPLLKELPPVFNNLDELTVRAAKLTDKLDSLKQNGAQLVFQKKGETLIEIFRNIRRDISVINSLTSDIKNQAKKLEINLDEELNDISPRLANAENFLDVFINWLDDSRYRHLLIMFQNPSEIRPAGGFMGSFADVTLKRGGLVKIEVNDIYDFDGQLKEKIIPPTQLQQLTIDWGARDANWFFDFPTSARKTVELLEKSLIYQERDIKFDGAIAINVNVLKDILDIIGPVKLQENKLTINADNFLSEIQRDVETDQNKDVLKELTLLIFESLTKLTGKQKIELVKKIGERISDKDIMIYLDNLVLESYLQSLGVGGEVTPLPPDFFGDYLAVVNANIAGGKTDAFINQQIKLASHVQDNGEILHALSVTRTHSGGKEKDAWYNKINQNFVQIFTTPRSELINIGGNKKKNIKPLINYKKANYKTDEDLRAIESGEQSGKKVFTAWTYVAPQETNALKLDYKSPYKYDLKANVNQPYAFIFEKQSGVNSELEFSIEAPADFVWQESGGPYFIYRNKKPPARTIIELHLVKLD